jgi:hypothetical protein
VLVLPRRMISVIRYRNTEPQLSFLDLDAVAWTGGVATASSGSLRDVDLVSVAVSHSD